MKIGAILCLGLAGCFFLLALLFSLLKAKGAVLISGFNTLPANERALYDQARMSRDMKNTLFLWGSIFSVGGLLAFLFGNSFVMVAFAVWLALFFKEVHLDPDDAFKKYKI